MTAFHARSARPWDRAVHRDRVIGNASPLRWSHLPADLSPMIRHESGRADETDSRTRPPMSWRPVQGSCLFLPRPCRRKTRWVTRRWRRRHPSNIQVKVDQELPEALHAARAEQKRPEASCALLLGVAPDETHYDPATPPGFMPSARRTRSDAFRVWRSLPRRRAPTASRSESACHARVRPRRKGQPQLEELAVSSTLHDRVRPVRPRARKPSCAALAPLFGAPSGGVGTERLFLQ
jgi:hypothetical protein